jgi:hypothetical protein
MRSVPLCFVTLACEWLDREPISNAHTMYLGHLASTISRKRRISRVLKSRKIELGKTATRVSAHGCFLNRLDYIYNLNRHALQN